LIDTEKISYVGLGKVFADFFHRLVKIRQQYFKEENLNNKFK
jgi:hypothetical protein